MAAGFNRLDALSSAPFPRILEHPEPGRCCEILFPVSRHICPLPFQKCPLRMGHHGEVSSVRRAERCHARRGTIWIEGIYLSIFIIVVYKTYRRQFSVKHLLHNITVGESEPPLAMIEGLRIMETVENRDSNLPDLFRTNLG